MLKKLALAGIGFLLVAPLITSALAFSAQPHSGLPPLAVKFTGIGLDTASNTYSVDFGDASTAGSGSCTPTTGGTCTPGTLYFNHTYTKLGTSTAWLLAASSTDEGTNGETVNVASTTVVITGATSTSCVVLTHNMGEGDTDAGTDGDVSKLQLFLAHDSVIYPEGTVDGTFSAPTTAAVERWQAAHNIASGGTPETTGYGYVGPKTRAAMAKNCGGGNGKLSASPRGGPPPLAVFFTVTNLTGSRTIDFGDGASATSQTGSSAAHTYLQSGLYTATLSAGGSPVDSVVINVGGSAQACIILTEDMGPGDSDSTSNGEVSKLQAFLAKDPDIYPEGTVSGFYGPATTRAVQRWQKENGVVAGGSPETNGYGAIGQKTRAALGRGCPILVADPKGGAAPIEIDFTAANLDQVNKYTLDFGDGTTSLLRVDTQAGNTFGAQASHTYTSGGSFNAKVTKTVTPPCRNNFPPCQRPDTVETVASTTVTIAGGTPTTTATSTFTATPASGAAPLIVSFTSNLIGSNTVDFGDGAMGTMSPAPVCATCIPVSTAGHTYQSGGTFIAKLFSGLQTAQTQTVLPPACNGLTGTSGCTQLLIGSAGTPIATTTITVTGAAACASITHDMERGDVDAEVGGDVSRLQATLAKDSAIYPEGLVTGSFGRLTEKAVKKFQAKYNISPTGFVGPLTREALKKFCAGESPGRGKYSFKVKPASGQAPLSVTFTAVNTETSQNFGYAVDFGDGTPHGSMDEESDNTLTVDHTYGTSTTGSYTAKLLQVEDLCGGLGGGFGCTRELQVDSATVTVNAATVDVCPNIEGVQTTVPAGMTKDASGNCTFATVATSTAPVACQGTYKVTNNINAYTAVLSISNVDSSGNITATIDFDAPGYDPASIFGTCTNGTITFSKPQWPQVWTGTYTVGGGISGTFTNSVPTGLFPNGPASGAWSAKRTGP